ncbi:MAG: hypothetical protein ACFUZC_15435 [Chthoniobacteraceae bacterium]
MQKAFLPAFIAVGLLSICRLEAMEPCRIEVVEKGSGWPVPMVELETTSHVTLITDNAGVVAFDLPEFMNHDTWLIVRSHGYEIPKDGLGNRGFRFKPVPGGTKRIEITRTNVAKRLGRLTGSGIFGESQKLGEHLDWQESGVTGQDTVQLTPYQGKLFWGWGDTNISSYALGLFKSCGAISESQPLKSFEPPLALNLEYIRNQKGDVCNLVDAENSGPIWVGGCVSLLDGKGGSHLVGAYSKIKGTLDRVEYGLVEWNDAAAKWKPLRAVWKKGESGVCPRMPDNHAAFWTDPSGRKWVYFGEALPTMRCPATYEAWADPSTWENVENPNSLTSAADGKAIQIASGSMAWNFQRKRWLVVFQRKGGASGFGEIWYAEGTSPSGPWGKAVKIVSHNNYTFYNPMIDADLVPNEAKFILFEGTYTSAFANHAQPTPRYDYNQIMYRLDLDDPALLPAQTE